MTRSDSTRDLAALRAKHAGAVDRLDWWRQREAFARAAIDEISRTIAALDAEIAGLEAPAPGATTRLF